MPVSNHGHKSFLRTSHLRCPALEHFFKHRLKYNHSAVRKVPVHFKVYVKGFVLVLVDGHSVYQHSGVSVGYPALGKYVIEQYGCACKYLFPLYAHLVIFSAVEDFSVQIRNLVLALFDHTVVKFGVGFVCDLARDQVLDLLFQREDFFFIFANLQIISGLLFYPLLYDLIVFLALGDDLFFEILDFSEH